MGKLVYTDQSGMEVSLPIGPDFPVISIGRATDCTIQSNRKSVSRHHAEFRYNNGRYEVIDLNSSNGTFVIIDNERRPIQQELLAHADEIWCGDFVLHFYEDDSLSDYEPLEDELDSTINHASQDVAHAINMHQHDHGAQDFSQPPAPPANDSGFNAYASQDSYQSGDGIALQDYAMDEESFVMDLNHGFDGQQLQQLQQDNSELEAQLANKTVEVHELQQKVEEQHRELEDLRQELNHQLQSSVEQEEYERVKQQLEQSESQLNQLRMQIDSLEQQLVQAQQQSAQIPDNSKELVALQQQLAQSQHELDALKKSSENAQQELLEAQKELNQAQRELTGVQKELTTVQKEVLTLQKDLYSAQNERDLAVRDVEHLQQKLDAAQHQVADSPSIGEDHSAAMNVAEHTIPSATTPQEYENLVRQLDEAEAQLESYEQSIATLTQELQAVQSERDEILESMSAEPSTPSATPQSSTSIDEELLLTMIAKVDTLDRIVEAIVRTDFNGLSTVDRIRLQSAIRETRPQETLTELRTLAKESLAKTKEEDLDAMQLV